MKARRGFTLLEVLLALTALALVAAICYGAFHLGIRAVERGEVAVVTAQRLRVASDLLIRQVKSAVPYCAWNKEDEALEPYFRSTATSMTFVTAAGQEGGGGLALVSYRVLDDPPRLVMTESHSFSSASLERKTVDRPDERETVVLDGFRSLRFECAINDGAELNWQTACNGHDDEMIPAVVQVTIEGLAGIEVDPWVQSIPIIATIAMMGDSGGECPEDIYGDDGGGDEGGGDEGGGDEGGGDDGGGGE